MELDWADAQTDLRLCFYWFYHVMAHIYAIMPADSGMTLNTYAISSDLIIRAKEQRATCTISSIFHRFSLHHPADMNYCI